MLIDCPPSLGVLTLNALTAADEVIVPLQCETLSHRGVGQLLDTVADVQRLTNRDLGCSGVLPTLYDGRTNHAREVLADVADRYGLPVLEPPIPRRCGSPRRRPSGRSVLATASGVRGAAAYREHAARHGARAGRAGRRLSRPRYEASVPASGVVPALPRPRPPRRRRRAGRSPAGVSGAGASDPVGAGADDAGCSAAPDSAA